MRRTGAGGQRRSEAAAFNPDPDPTWNAELVTQPQPSSGQIQEKLPKTTEKEQK